MHHVRSMVPFVLAAATALGGCGKSKKADTAPTPMPTPVAEQTPPNETSSPTPAPAPPKAEEPQNTTDSDMEGILKNFDEHQWKPVPSLPKGATIAVLEGEPPFGPGKGFSFLLKFPKGYKIPPHTHLVTERVTVLKGSLAFGHGEKIDAKGAKMIEAGGIVAVPAGHTHFVINGKGETIVQLQGVGPWGIFYINPKDDPRGKDAPPKPENVEHPTDSDIEMITSNPADIKWNPGPPSLPAGAQIAVVEGAPPFGAGKSFVFRLKMPDGYKIPVHHHLVTERVSVLSGTLKFGMGDAWKDADMKALKVGGLAFMPRNHKHYVQAVGETVVQLQGVGPWGIIYANAAEDPRAKK